MRQNAPPWDGLRFPGARLAAHLQLDPASGDGSPQHEAHLEFLFDALDIWAERSRPDTGTTIPGTFWTFFTTADEPEDGSRVCLFFRSDSARSGPVDLFEACCRTYGLTRGRARVFSLGQTLVLYALVLHLIEDTPDFPRRVRLLRNLVEASADELRPEGCRSLSMMRITSSAMQNCCESAIHWFPADGKHMQQ